MGLEKEMTVRNKEAVRKRLLALARSIPGIDFTPYDKDQYVDKWIPFAVNMLGGVSHIAANIYQAFDPQSRTIFTDHGIGHSLRVARLGTQLAKSLIEIERFGFAKKFYQLLPHFHCASLLHDIGMYLRDTPNEWSVRKDHGNASANAVYAFFKSRKDKFMCHSDVRYVADLCRLHQGKNDLDKFLENKEERRLLAFWAWIIRMSDALDFSLDRSPKWVWPFYRERYWEPASSSKFEWDVNSTVQKVWITHDKVKIYINVTMVPPSHFEIVDMSQTNLLKKERVRAGKYDYPLKQYAVFCKHVLKYYALYLNDHFSTVTDGFFEERPEMRFKLHGPKDIESIDSKFNECEKKEIIKAWKGLVKTVVSDKDVVRKSIGEHDDRPAEMIYRDLVAMEMDNSLLSDIEPIYNRLCDILGFKGLGNNLLDALANNRFWLFIADKSTKCLHPWLPVLENKEDILKCNRRKWKDVMLPPKCGVLGYTAYTGQPTSLDSEALRLDIRNIYPQTQRDMDIDSVCFLPLLLKKDGARNEFLGVAGFNCSKSKVDSSKPFKNFESNATNKISALEIAQECEKLNVLLEQFGKEKT